MRKIYLIRHGMPDIPNGTRMCLGRTDLPLGSLGILQATLLGVAFKDTALSGVYCSKLLRSRQTAALIGEAVTELPGLEEMDAGEWDGLTFDEIQAHWPMLYDLRGKDPSVSPPGAEDRKSGQKRFMAAVRRALSETTGDIAVVAHASVMQTLLCAALALPLDKARSIKLPYGSISELSYEDDHFFAHGVGTLPRPVPDATFCKKLLLAAALPDIAAHCEAVAKESSRITQSLSDAGVGLDEDLVFTATMLHDIARLEENHAATGAAWLHALGYPKIAEVVRQHHDLDDVSRIDEAAVVFIADKLVRGTKRVSLRERFEESFSKCTNAEAQKAHDKRYEVAVMTAARINELCGKDVAI
ncbi:histidine phosphatase family protein [Oscillospiraceae bacterium LTW-04]|nr:histidine phosphatase family protein [Oscillospiraceae bacterium MB24-C1]